MSERQARLHLLGIAAGLLAGGLLGYLLRPAPAVVYPEAVVPAGAPETPGLGGRAPLSGAPRQAGPRPDGQRAGGTQDTAEIPLPLLEDGWRPQELAGLSDARSPAQDRSVRGCLARATLHALAGEVVEAGAQLETALTEGATTREALDVCSLLRDAAWLQVVERLRAAFTEAAWDPGWLARCAHKAQNGPWGWRILLDELERAETTDEELVQTMVELDARKAGALFLARLLADPESLSVDACGIVARGLKAAPAEAEAATFLRALLAAHPFDDEALELLLEVDVRAAEAHALRRLAQRADDTQAWRTLAGIRSERGETAGALEAYRRLAELQPEPSTLAQVLAADPALGLQLALRAAEGSTNDELLGTLGAAYVGNDELGKAFEAYQRAADLDPEDHQWLGSLVELDPVRAAEVLAERAQAGDAGDETVGAYGNALLESGQYEAAYVQYERALRKDPSDFEWQFGLARADGARAVPVLSELLAEEPDSTWLQSAVGMALIGSGRREEGLRRMEAAARRSPDYTTCSQLCRADPVRGRAVLEHLLRTDPENDEWHGILGDLHARAGQRDRALAAYARARALDPTDDYWPRRMALLRVQR